MKETVQKYIEAVGRRKTSVARVRIFVDSKNSYLINDRDIISYFKTEEIERLIHAPLSLLPNEWYRVSAHVKGGGIHSQAEAIRAGIARAIIKATPLHRELMKKAGFLKIDGRQKERRKFGLKKARKAPKWSKR